MKTSLTSQIKKIVAVVHLGENQTLVDDVLNSLTQFLQMDCFKFAFILHDKDIQDDGSLKIPHVHICCETNKKVRLSTFLNSLADIFHVNPLAVSVDKMSSFEGAFQYLIHKNNPSKFQYSKNDIKTNLSDSEVDLVLESTANAITPEYILSVCLGARTLYDVIDALGLDFYCRYHVAVKDIWKEQHEAEKDLYASGV